MTLLTQGFSAVFYIVCNQSEHSSCHPSLTSSAFATRNRNVIPTRIYSYYNKSGSITSSITSRNGIHGTMEVEEQICAYPLGSFYGQHPLATVVNEAAVR